ncbi:carbohydrate kinase family protein [Marinobacter shengliensis]|uniref:Carbohydrate kinase family protein n=1 Tax=Marinobacter shengliensis TaxID=1389223 RepID=A0ABV4W2I3_9GAMM
MPSSIMILGGTSLDTIVHLDQLPAPVPQTIWPRRAYRSVGSTGAGKSLNLAALGHRVTLHTLLGRDAEAETIRQQLAKPGIRLLLETTDTPTEQHVNLMTAAGERISLFVQPPAEPETVDWRPVQERLPETDLVVANILAYVKPALDWLRGYGRPVWTDLHDYDGSDSYHQPFIDAADVIFLASDNLPDYRRTMEQLIRGGKSFVVCTHGSAGATLLSSDGKWLEQAAIRVSEVIDTNGAGDAFFSGFLHRYLHGGNLKTCLRAGAMAGALCVTSQDLVSNRLTPEALA